MIMKKNKRAAAFILLAVLAAAGARAQAARIGSLGKDAMVVTNEVDAARMYQYGSPDIVDSPAEWFDFTNNTITTFHYKNDRKHVVIPWKINGEPVTKIGEYAFSSSKTLQGMRILSIRGPQSLVYVGYRAFYDCEFLESVSFPAVNQVGNEAFYQCADLTSLLLPSVANVGGYAFSSCDGLTSVSLPSAKTFSSSVFSLCPRLTAVHFAGAPPTVTGAIYAYSPNVTNYVSNPSAPGWGSTFGDRPVVRLPLFAGPGGNVATTGDLAQVAATIPSIAGLASTNELALAVAPLATTQELAQVAATIPSIAGLASTNELALAVAPLATTQELAQVAATIPSIAGLASTNELALAVAPLATTQELAQVAASIPSIAGLASTSELAQAVAGALTNRVGKVWFGSNSEWLEIDGGTNFVWYRIELKHVWRVTNTPNGIIGLEVVGMPYPLVSGYWYPVSVTVDVNYDPYNTTSVNFYGYQSAFQPATDTFFYQAEGVYLSGSSETVTNTIARYPLSTNLYTQADVDAWWQAVGLPDAAQAGGQAAAGAVNNHVYAQDPHPGYISAAAAPEWVAVTNLTGSVVVTNTNERPVHLHATGDVSLTFAGLRSPAPLYLVVQGANSLAFPAGTHFVGGGSYQTNAANHFIVWTYGTNLFINPVTTSED